MDWNHRWFLCGNCDSYIRTPKAFLDHKKKCEGRKNRVTALRVTPEEKRSSRLSDDVGTKKSRKLGKFQCQFCQYATKAKHNFIRHTRRHTGTGERPFVCKLCNFVSNLKWSLIMHSKCHTGETPFKCSDCPASFNSRKALGYHVGRQHPIEEYQPQRSKVESSIDSSTGSLSKKFKCEFCEYVTKTFQNLKRHIRIHTDVKPFVCKLCNYACIEPSSLTKHNRVHAGDTPFKCNECPASFNKRNALTLHITKQHQERDPNEREPYAKRSNGESKSCRFCSKVLRCVAVRKQHERIHTGERLFKCNKCDASYKLNSHLQRHMVTHGDVKNFKCDFCNYAFTQASSLKTHNRVHIGDTPFKCNECPASFNKQHALTVHITKQHQERGPNEPEPYSRSNGESKSCRFCSKVLKSVYGRKEHERIHTGERPFKCNKCDASYKKYSHLQTHMVTHDVKKFKCGFCNYACHHKNSMIIHVRSHTGERPYKCSQCDAAFQRSANLSEHMDIHNNVKKYKCNICGAAFRQRSNLSHHVGIHHNTEKSSANPANASPNRKPSRVQRFCEYTSF